jgi:hypothetical protein
MASFTSVGRSCWIRCPLSPSQTVSPVVPGGDRALLAEGVDEPDGVRHQGRIVYWSTAAGPPVRA